ncbi:MAG: nitrogen-fixing NifU domain protein [Bacteroidetes bacterium]|jgi:Fe-S cluster biogenesis protein NfuA|nr:nitrogen-fixing NifU domain protein [Bacteroidota bacterium]MDP2885710.1 NifU family protein [Ignavibacteria bacterium]
MITTEILQKSLEQVRPYLQRDGGDVEFVRMTDDGIVEVRLTGSCVSCPMSLMTLRAGVERALMLAHTEIRRVEQVR